MKNAKALYITNLGLLDNLAKTQVLPYLEALAKKGISIHILSFEKGEYLKNRALIDKMEHRLKDSNMNWERLAYHRRWGNAWDILKGIAKIFQIVKAKDISILHARASIPILMAWPAAKILKCKIIYDRRGTMVGDFVDDVNIKNIFSNSIFYRLIHAIDKFIIRHSDATIVLSERALEMLKVDRYISGGNKIIESIPCCVDISKYEDDKIGNGLQLTLSERFTLCYLGSLGTCYLLKEMADFFKTLKQKKANALFLVISHTQKSYIEDIMQKEMLKPTIDYVIITLSPEEVPGYLAKSKCSIMFIKPVECKIGSSPTKFGESLAAGIPVIINRGVGDTEDIIWDNRVGVVVDGFAEYYYNEAIDRLDELMRNGDLPDRCRLVAKRYFSLTDGVDKYEAVYKNLMSDNRG